MVYSFKLYFSLLVTLVPWFLFISLSDARPNRKPTTTLINQICSQTIGNPSLCLQVLESDTRSARADLRGLGKISIDIARKDAKQTSNLSTSLMKEATNSSLKGRYDYCAELYGDAIDDLNGAGQILNKKVLSPLDISDFRIRATTACSGPNFCDDGFDEGLPNEPSKLKEASKKYKDLCEIVLVIGASFKSG
ncbi:pectinesterase inhibitor-like [Rhododendron vialii]|uniref:pectinesterase inhibitor-like n=1 Tax=Rhododendron vialii TaxID=182163 RepID=UPI00265E7B4E|nr:pectinesterase inhibitor-like [Rhododendron vialii]